MEDLKKEFVIPVFEKVIPEGTEYKKLIVTHSGKFHADETTACALISLLPEFNDAIILRVGHGDVEEVLKEGKFDIMLDIGAKYSVEEKVFDHHQRSFEEHFSEDYKTRMSSVGLVWKHFGVDIIMAIAKIAGIEDLPDFLAKKFHIRLYENFIEHLDANDNGIMIAEEMKFKIKTALTSRISNFNPNWNDESQDSNPGFLKAVNLARKEFLESLSFYLKVWYPAREYAMKFWKDRLMDGHVMELKRFLPWRGHVYDFEEEENCEGVLLFTIFEETRSTKKSWRYIGVGKKAGSFDLRVNAPKEWCGLRDVELSKVAGIEGCTFVHSSGFTGGNWTKEGLLKMISVMIEQHRKE